MTPSDDDRELFRKAVEGVRPLPPREAPVTPPAPLPRARFRRADEAQVLAESMAVDPEGVDDTGEDLSFRRPSVGLPVFRKLRRGEFSVREEIDLHGLTAVEARAALYEFLAEAGFSGARCVRVIHGKGRRSGHRGPVLKRKIGKWLQVRDDVLAYCSARPVDGGTGAIYVLLS
ncbi:Smr/MutS family protein [Wenzhouxiangella sp. XN24]|uniref:Smr/MutS family protein n=1 Tax=Wenzhouxiangella sp. XN24 TaxID=2713569 RepID=UPI0013EDEE71|nr:Smr/MutS family protein [Wenzhouxiangella sp. XN24]NGX16770.1 Smr/MutS family protein [Wenzhouxiangella sp. XN24]